MVGLFVIIALGAFGWLIFMFGDLPVLVGTVKSYHVKVQFPSAPGVQENTPVRFCGYQIGRVTRVSPPEVLKDLNTGRFYHQTMVILGINRKFDDIPADVEAKLMSRGLGSSYVDLKLRAFDVNEPTGEMLKPGSLLQGSTGVTSEFFPEESQKKLEEMVDGIVALVENANNILGDPQNRENLRVTLSNLSQATAQATVSLQEFERFSAAGTRTLTNANDKLDSVMSAMVDASEQLSETAAQFKQVLWKVNHGQGTAGKFVNDGRLYENLLENSHQLEILIEEMKYFVAESRQKGLPIKLK